MATNYLHLMSNEQQALTWIATQHDVMLARLLRWTAINSGSQNLVGLSQMATELADVLAELGTVHRRPPSPVEVLDAQGARVNIVRGDNLHVVVRPTAPLQILLAGHMDTVFATDHPFQVGAGISNGLLNAPGAADMKGGLLVLLTALAALERSPQAEQIGYQIVINADEEVSSLGSVALLRQAAQTAHLGLVYEPALADGGMAGARKGIGSYTALVRGKAAHAGRNPEQGRNAVLAVAAFFVALASLNGCRDGVTINPARVDGGGPTNVVPALALGRFEVRVARHEDRAFIENEIQRLVMEIAATHDVTIELVGQFHRPPKPLDAHQLQLFEAVRACGADIGQSVHWAPSGGCCDGNNLADAGLAVVDTLGVRGDYIHSDKEYMVIDSLVERSQLSALLLLRLASGAIHINRPHA